MHIGPKKQPTSKCMNSEKNEKRKLVDAWGLWQLNPLRSLSMSQKALIIGSAKTIPLHQLSESPSSSTSSVDTHVLCYSKSLPIGLLLFKVTSNWPSAIQVPFQCNFFVCNWTKFPHNRVVATRRECCGHVFCFFLCLSSQIIL